MGKVDEKTEVLSSDPPQFQNQVKSLAVMGHKGLWESDEALTKNTSKTVAINKC